jgi:D-aminopeptidase
MRSRDLGIPLSGVPGGFNAITDVPGVEVGYATLWRGSGLMAVGQGPVRTGVTAVLPRGRNDPRPCFGGSFALNGSGELTGLLWLEERGFFEGPILITNTHSVGEVRDATVQWMRLSGWPQLLGFQVPIIGETYDGVFNDINGGHVKREHVFQALEAASSGPIAEGNVGGGAGMMTYWYKGGTGTASRRLEEDDGGYTVGVLVQSNFGRREQLRIGGIPVGRALSDDLPRYLEPDMLPPDLRHKHEAWRSPSAAEGSIIVVVATDAPLLPHQLRRLAKRPALGMARLGAIGMAVSGDLFVSFSTGNPDIGERMGEHAASVAPHEVKMHPNLALSALFEAAIDATEEAILNAMVAADSAEGANRLFIPRLPHERVTEILRAHNLLKLA